MDKIQEEIIEEFSVFDDWLDKDDYLIGLSDSLPAIPAEHRTVQYLIEGCQSRVWVDARMEQGRVYYAADSDAIITKGIIALLIRVLNGRTPQEILDTELYFIDAIGLSANLSPTRSNGLLSMVKQMRVQNIASVFPEILARHQHAHHCQRHQNTAQRVMFIPLSVVSFLSIS